MPLILFSFHKVLPKFQASMKITADRWMGGNNCDAVGWVACRFVLTFTLLLGVLRRRKHFLLPTKTKIKANKSLTQITVILDPREILILAVLTNFNFISIISHTLHYTVYGDLSEMTLSFFFLKYFEIKTTKRIDYLI